MQPRAPRRGWSCSSASAQTLVQIGAFVWPALLPGMVARWTLTNSEAGWITAIFYAAYIVAVPIIVPLTDRFDAKFVYLCGVAATVAGHLLFGFLADGFWSAMAARALTGIGWAGTYMTGLKLLADKVDARMLSRAAAGHAASIGVSGALSFAFAELAEGLAGWRAAFLAAGISAALAWADRRARGAGARTNGASARIAARLPARGVRFPAGAAQSIRHGLRARLLRPHA